MASQWAADGPCCAILVAVYRASPIHCRALLHSLSAILGVDQGMLRFEQTVVWPTSAITQAQGLVGIQQGIFTRIQL